MANIAYKYRFYPTPAQVAWLLQCCGCARFIWNKMLDDKIACYKDTGKMLHNTPAQYKGDFPFLKEVDCQALCNVQIDLQDAYKNYFSDPAHYRFPKHKSKKKTKASYTTNNINNNIRVGNNYIRLPKVHRIKAKIHRRAPKDYKLKSATVSMEADGSWYVSVLYEYEEETKLVPKDEAAHDAIGLDYKSNGLFVTDTGKCAEMPKFYSESQKHLARAQRKASRKCGNKKGETPSNNFKRAQKRVAKIARHIANERKDFLHKTSTEIANRYKVVCIEDLNMTALANHGFHNGKATLDNGYGAFTNMLAYKQRRRGHYLVRVARDFPSTQTC
ncbi:MAG: transposase, partial [Eggerthellaceae bacterium]|nr:transposase [Eggerthellaceae bacterium]